MKSAGRGDRIIRGGCKTPSSYDRNLNILDGIGSEIFTLFGSPKGGTEAVRDARLVHWSIRSELSTHTFIWLGFGVWGLGFAVWGLGFGVWGWECGV